MQGVTLIVAADEGNGIGKDGAMPWHLPADLAHFKRLTMGKPMVMGRRTFEAIGRVLPGRPHIVVTRARDWSHPEVTVAHSLDEALAAARAFGDEVMVVGGGQLYAEALPRADRVYLTRIHTRCAADTFFPVLPAEEWQEVAREARPADERNPHALDFLTYERR